MSQANQHGPEKKEGGQREVIVSDDDVTGLLTQIIKELKKMNLHLAIMSDNYIKNTEVD